LENKKETVKGNNNTTWCICVCY